MKKERIIITVRGGIVQHIASTNPDLQIEIMDFDNEDFEGNAEPVQYEPDEILPS